MESKLITELLGTDSYKKFKRFMMNYEVSRSGNKRFCPFPDCETIIAGRKGQLKTLCISCHRDFCFQCQTAWHKNKTCKQAQKEMFKDWAFVVGANKCPKCQAPVEKNDGCNHMSCTQCSHRWCWVCGLPLNHWSHSLSNGMPFSCKTAPSNLKGWMYHIVLFVIGIVLMPLFILLAITGLVMYASLSCH